MWFFPKIFEDLNQGWSTRILYAGPWVTHIDSRFLKTASLVPFFTLRVAGFYYYFQIPRITGVTHNLLCKFLRVIIFFNRKYLNIFFYLNLRSSRSANISVLFNSFFFFCNIVFNLPLFWSFSRYSSRVFRFLVSRLCLYSHLPSIEMLL